MRYATRLDLIDGLTTLAARSSVAEAALRRAVSWKRRTGYLSWALMSRIYRLAGIDRGRSLDGLLAARDGEANDLLLLTDSPLHIPELVAVAAMLEQCAGLKDAVTVIVPDRKVEAELRHLAGRARITTVQRFWLDHRHDVANHDAAHAVLSMFRTALQRRPVSERAAAMFDAVSMHLHTGLISALRVASAVRAARDEGARIVVAALDGDVRLQELCFEAMARAGERPVIALTQHGIRGGLRFERVDRALDLDARLADGRAHLGTYRDASDSDVPPECHAADHSMPSVPRAGDRANEIALVSDALPGSIYWQAVFNLAEAARLEGRTVRALVSRASTARKLRAVCASVDVAGVALGATSGTRFAADYGAFLDVVADVARMPRPPDSAIAALAVDYAVARLSAPVSIDAIGYRSYRTAKALDRWLRDRPGASVVVLPHWSTLAWAAQGAARRLRCPTASIPVVTVSGTNASIVEWNGVDVIGCYGTQCKRAFQDLGYPERKLALIGNLSLDRAVFVPRASARARHRVYTQIASRGQRIILYATSGVNKNEAEILRAIAALCRDPAANAALVVRPHPSIGRAFYADCLAASPALASIYGGGSIHDAIAAADVVITDFSTVGADAVHLKRPLLVVNTTGAPFPANNYADLGVAVEANAIAQIAPSLLRLLDEGFWWPAAEASLARFTQAYNWRGDGSSCHRFLAEIDAYRSNGCAADTPRSALR